MHPLRQRSQAQQKTNPETSKPFLKPRSLHWDGHEDGRKGSIGFRSLGFWLLGFRLLGFRLQDLKDFCGFKLFGLRAQRLIAEGCKRFDFRANP